MANTPGAVVRSSSSMAIPRSESPSIPASAIPRSVSWCGFRPVETSSASPSSVLPESVSTTIAAPRRSTRVGVVPVRISSPSSRRISSIAAEISGSSCGASGGALHDRHPAAEAVEGLAELQPLGAAAEDDQPRRQLLDVHDGLVRQVADLVEAWNRGDVRLDAGGDDDPLALKRAPFDRDPVRRFEAPEAANELDPRVLLEASLETAAHRRDEGILALDDSREVHLHLGAEAELGSPAGGVDRFGGPDQGLRGDAPHVDSGSADLARLDDGDPGSPSGSAIRTCDAAHAGADDDQVERLVHPASFPRASAFRTQPSWG